MLISSPEQIKNLNEKKTGACSHLPFMIIGHISREHLRKFREMLFWPSTSNCYVTGKRQEKKSKILFLSLMLMQYTCLKYCLRSHMTASLQVQVLCIFKAKFNLNLPI